MNVSENAIVHEVSQSQSPVDGTSIQRAERDSMTQRISEDCVEPRVGDTAVELTSFSRSAQSQGPVLRAQLQPPFSSKEGDSRPQQPLFPVHTIVLPNKARGNFPKATQFSVRRSPNAVQQPQYFVATRAGRSQDVIGEEGPTVKQHLQQQQKQMKEKERLSQEQRQHGLPSGSGLLSQDAGSSPPPCSTTQGSISIPSSSVESHRGSPVISNEVRRKGSGSSSPISTVRVRKLPPPRQLVVSSSNSSYQNMKMPTLPVATYVVQPQGHSRSSEDRMATATQRYIVTHTPLTCSATSSVNDSSIATASSMIRSSSLDENSMLKALTSGISSRKRNLSSGGTTIFSCQRSVAAVDQNGGSHCVRSEQVEVTSINYQLTNDVRGVGKPMNGVVTGDSAHHSQGTTPNIAADYGSKKFKNKQMQYKAGFGSSRSTSESVDTSQPGGISNLLADDISSFFGSSDTEKAANDPFLGQIEEREALSYIPEMLLDSDNLLCEIPGVNEDDIKEDVSPTGFSLVDWLENDNLPMGGEMACNEDDFSEIFREDDGPLEVPDQELLNVCGVIESKDPNALVQDHAAQNSFSAEKQADACVLQQQPRPVLQVVRTSHALQSQLSSVNSISSQSLTSTSKSREKKQRSPKIVDAGKTDQECDKKTEKAIRLDRKRHEDRLLKQKRAEQDALDKQRMQEEQAQKERETVERVIRLQMQQIEAEREAAEAQQKTAPSGQGRSRARGNRSHASRNGQRPSIGGGRQVQPLQSTSSLRPSMPNSMSATVPEKKPPYPPPVSFAGSRQSPACSESVASDPNGVQPPFDTTVTKNTAVDRVGQPGDESNAKPSPSSTSVVQELPPRQPATSLAQVCSRESAVPVPCSNGNVPQIPTHAALAARTKPHPSRAAIIAALEKSTTAEAIERAANSSDKVAQSDVKPSDSLVTLVAKDTENFPDELLWEMLEESPAHRSEDRMNSDQGICNGRDRPRHDVEEAKNPVHSMDPREQELLRQEQDIKRDINTLLSLLEDEEREGELIYLENQIDGTEQAISDYYGKKLKLLKDTFTSLVFTNAALVDEVSRLSNRVIVTTEERKMLARRLCHHNRNYIRRLQTAKKRKSEAEKRKQELVEKQAEVNVAEIKAKFAKHEVVTSPESNSKSQYAPSQQVHSSDMFQSALYNDDEPKPVKIKGKRGRKRSKLTTSQANVLPLCVSNEVSDLNSLTESPNEKKLKKSNRESAPDHQIRNENGFDLLVEEPTGSRVAEKQDSLSPAHSSVFDVTPDMNGEAFDKMETSNSNNCASRKSARKNTNNGHSAANPLEQIDEKDRAPSRGRSRLKNTGDLSSSPHLEGEKTRRSNRVNSQSMAEENRLDASVAKTRGRPTKNRPSDDSCPQLPTASSPALHDSSPLIDSKMSLHTIVDTNTGTGSSIISHEKVEEGERVLRSRRSTPKHPNDTPTSEDTLTTAADETSAETANTLQKGRRGGRNRSSALRESRLQKDAPFRQSLRRKS